MAKVFTMMMMLASVEVLLELGGVGVFGSLLSNFAYGGNWSSGLLILVIFGLLGIVAIGGAIAVGVFGRSISESYYLAPVAFSILTIFVVDAFSIVNYINTAYPDMSWLGNTLGALFFIITVGFIIALVQWFRGNDI